MHAIIPCHSVQKWKRLSFGAGFVTAKTEKISGNVKFVPMTQTAPSGIILYESSWWESNSRSPLYKRGALTTVLHELLEYCGYRLYINPKKVLYSIEMIRSTHYGHCVYYFIVLQVLKIHSDLLFQLHRLDCSDLKYIRAVCHTTLIPNKRYTW